MPRTGIEPMYMDFQSTALPLSYPIPAIGVEPMSLTPKTSALPLSYTGKTVDNENRTRDTGTTNQRFTTKLYPNSFRPK